ncbi:MAG: hypothetical protein NC191_00250 [Muribaculaceae bacterium]|nr:hypothetical protein [Muribaculaceae bacterium]
MSIENTFDLGVPVTQTNLQKAKTRLHVPISNDLNIGEHLKCQNDATYVASKEIPMIRNHDEIIADLQVMWTKNAKVKDQLFHGTAEDLNTCLKGTKLEGLGQTFIDAQEKYGVNAILLMSIAKVESGLGNAPAKDKKGIHKYNISGLKKRSGGYQDNTSYEQCVDSCASSLRRLYFNAKPARATLEQIRKNYCPGNLKWSSDVAKEMNNFLQTISTKYGFE